MSAAVYGVHSYNAAIEGKSAAEHAFNRYKADVEAREKQALKDKDRIEKENEAKTKRSNEDLKRARSELASANDGWMRLAKSRAAERYLPSPAPDSPSPDRAVIERSEFESAMERLDARGAELAAQGDRYRVDLDEAKKDAQYK
jgi:flagellar biosynthesis GTPase FlhF